MKQHHKVSAAGTAVCALTLLSGLTAPPCHALPQDGAVVGGAATISQPNPTTMNINQTSANAIINWQGYSIGANEAVKYLQPGSSSIALNRVTGVDPSHIYGLLSGNGQVWVINPNGLLVGPGATVQTGGFLASTMNITDENFLSGKYTFTAAPGSQASIANQGTISVADGGYVVLAAPSVSNSGTIVANLGTVHLASGDTATLTIDNGSLINVAVDGAVAAQALGVTNSGRIS
ncbi:MAG: filamentous hemagglutinin N-terminal domain-containing protein, partial [Desulfuromonadaceae bacterium]|nr:filamentous hemagglutinin N-terminal domain-containing protein [Desulfuromonadaceae bacterium]